MRVLPVMRGLSVVVLGLLGFCTDPAGVWEAQSEKGPMGLITMQPTSAPDLFDFVWNSPDADVRGFGILRDKSIYACSADLSQSCVIWLNNTRTRELTIYGADGLKKEGPGEFKKPGGQSFEADGMIAVATLAGSKCIVFQLDGKNMQARIQTDPVRNISFKKVSSSGMNVKFK